MRWHKLAGGMGAAWGCWQGVIRQRLDTRAMGRPGMQPLGMRP